jgi:hypothetical protein
MAIGDDKVPDVDHIIYLGGAERATVQLNTLAIDTGAPTIDLHVIASNDLVTFGGPTSGHYQNNVFTAQAKDLQGYAVITNIPRAIKLRADVNTAAITAGEYFQAIVYVDDFSPGGRDKPKAY